MTRQNRRYEGGPEYPLEIVHVLASLSQIIPTRKALHEAGRTLPKSIAHLTGAIRKTLQLLEAEHWKFAEENERGWVDVYRILSFNRLLWIKLKVEKRHGKDSVIVISFHDYDDDIPI